MKRPMCVIGLSLTLSTPIAFLFTGEQALLLSVAAALTALLAVISHIRNGRILCLALLSSAVGFASYSLYCRQNITPFERAAGETVLAQGLVTEASQGRRAIFYTMRASFPDRPGLPDAVLMLRTFGEMDVLPGNVIACDVRLDQEIASPGDYSFSRGGIVSGQAVGSIQRFTGGYPAHRRLIEARQTAERNLYDLLPEEIAGLVGAMVLGLSDSVDSADYALFNRAGTAHLLTVSGLHLSILTGFLLNLLTRLRLGRRSSSLIAAAAVISFSALVGFSASITRAMLMTVLMLIARALDRRGDSLSALGFAAAVICLTHPFWLLGRGFWFSFCATLGILLLTGKLNALFSDCFQKFLPDRALRPLADALSPSVAAFLFTLPVMIFFNGWFSLVSLPANLLITPFVIPLTAGGILCGLIGNVSQLMRIAAAITRFCVTAVINISEAMSSLPYATMPLDEPWMLFWLALCVLAVVAVIRLRGGRDAAGYAALLTALCFGAGNLTQLMYERDSVQLAVIGDCDAAVLLRGDEAVILGTPAKNEVNRLLRYLEFRGVRKIAAIIAVDSGEQVGSGLLRLQERYSIDCLIGPNDAYILRQIAGAMPDVPVYSGGYAFLEVLGGARISLIPPGTDILLDTQDATVLKSAFDYDGTLQNSSHNIGLYSGGAVELLAARGVDPSPIGKLLFGEQRFLLRL